MTIKVCGMRDSGNIDDLIQLPIDYIGFIFYEKSPRFVSVMPKIFNVRALNTIKKVGVFVDADVGFVLNKIKEFGLNAVQLHGKETPQYLSELKIKKSKGVDSELNTMTNSELIEIWKAFSIDEQFNFSATKPYEQLADKFLFDTKTPQYGGSGQKFNWDLLEQYKGNTPFLLSGGISTADTEGIKNIRHSQFLGLDLNSKFEISPALKDVQLLREFLFSLNLF